MADTAGVLFKIKADSTDARKDIAKVKADLKDVSGSGLTGLASSATSAGGSLSALAGPAAVVAAGLAAVASAAAVGAVAIFNLTKSAAEYGSTIFDAQEKTGLTAETLTALDFAAKQSGTSLDAVVNASARLAKTVAEAQRGSEGAADTLKRLGVTSTDLDTALGQAIGTINAAGGDMERLALANDLAGKSGKDLIPLIKAIDGDLTGLRQKASALGVTLTQEDIVAADNFGDTLDVLSAQAAATGNKFATEMMPAITSAMESISKALADNKGVASAWGQAVVDVATGAAVAFEWSAKMIMASLLGINTELITGASYAPTWGQAIAFAASIAIGPVMALLTALRQIGAAQNKANAPVLGVDEMVLDTATMTMIKAPASVKAPGSISIPTGGGGGGGGKGKGGGGGAAKADQAAAEELRAQLELEKLKLSEFEKIYKDTIKRIRDEFKTSGDSDAFTTAAKKAKDDLTAGANEVIKALDALEKKALKNPTNTSREVLERKQKGRRDGISSLMSEDDVENEELIADAIKKIREGLGKAIVDVSEKVSDAVRANAYEELKTVIDLNTEILRSAYSTKAERIKAENEINAVIQKNARVLNYENTVKRDNDRLAAEQWKQQEEAKINATIKDEELREAALQEVNLIYQQRLDLINAIYNAEQRNIEAATSTPATSPSGSQQDLLLASVMSGGNTAAIAGVEALRTAFEGLGEALGNVVQSFVLYGKAGASVRQITAQILAAIAQQAAVKAIFQLAEGFAALAMGNGAQAGLHFKAAAIYGAVAVAAAVAGRIVAGNSFNQAAGSATGQGSGNGGNSQASQNNNFGGVFSGFQERQNNAIAVMTDRVNTVLGGVQESFDMFNQKFGIASPADVVMAGAGGASGAIFDANLSELNSGGRPTEDLARATGRYR